MKRVRLSLLIFVAVWAIVLFVPKLRQLAVLQVTGANEWTSSVLPKRELPKDYWVKTAKYFPDNPPVQAFAIENNGITSFGTFNNFIAPLNYPRLLRDYESVLTRFPNNPWLLSRRLRISIVHFKTDRIGGELSDAKGVENFKAGKPSPERNTQVKPNFTRVELERTIRLCKRGQRLEPGNAFWDWMLVNFLLMAWRDDEAWQTLKSAADKPHFNSHELDDAQNAIAVRSLVFGRPLMLEKRLLSCLAKAGLDSTGAGVRPRASSPGKVSKRGGVVTTGRLWSCGEVLES